jgi:SPW repeat-containing protein
MKSREQGSFRVINTRVHGVADCATGILLIASPYLFGFANSTAAQWVPMILGALVVGMSLLTRYELGLYGLIPMHVHLMLDAAQASLLIASPWLFGFSKAVYLPHLIIGIAELVIVALSQPQRRLR